VLYFCLIQRAGDFTGNTRAAFPYILAAKDGQTIFSKYSVPDGFSLGDPDHITGFNIDSLYAHWLGRQQKGLEPFIMLNAGPLHAASKKKSLKAKGKAKAKAQVAWVNCDTDDEKSEEEEEAGGGDSETEEGEDKSESDEKEEEEESGGGVSEKEEEVDKSELDEKDEEDEEEEEEELPARKFGPPVGKARSLGGSKKVNGPKTQEAGPSDISTSKKSSKKDPNGTNLLKTTLQVSRHSTKVVTAHLKPASLSISAED
jgi:hypothetical protein